jgi:TRAP-type C4-dicarboxylate transport system permease small subunit
LLGATLSFKNRADAVPLENVLPSRMVWLAQAVQSLAVVAFLGPVLYYCFFGARGVWGEGYIGRSMRLTADTLGMSMAWVALAVPISAAIILIHLLARWVAHESAAPAADD